MNRVRMIGVLFSLLAVTALSFSPCVVDVVVESSIPSRLARVGRCRVPTKVAVSSTHNNINDDNNNGNNDNNDDNDGIHLVTRQQCLERWTTFATTLAWGTTAWPSGATAKGKDEAAAAKGTKADPAYQTCLSNCMFLCTKPKGAEQKSRSECLPECKKQCATTKEQLMIGTPINKGS